jgi:hypothetical protein
LASCETKSATCIVLRVSGGCGNISATLAAKASALTRQSSRCYCAAPSPTDKSIPKSESGFFTLFEKLARIVVAGAEALRGLLQGGVVMVDNNNYRNS